ncbi:MAG: hypothetical protein ACM31E_10610, partial [Fibrobacterota bacterium]
MSILTALISLFGCNKTSEKKTISVTAQINQPVMPIQRGEIYEDPLFNALAEKQLGETTGGGSMLKESGEINFVDIEIELTDATLGIPFVINKLESLGA